MPTRTSELLAKQRAAIRKFPSETKLIEELVMRSQSFRELCEDLAEAERALTATHQMPVALGRNRRVECQEWIESLTKEIESALREAKTIPIA